MFRYISYFILYIIFNCTEQFDGQILPKKKPETKNHNDPQIIINITNFHVPKNTSTSNQTITINPLSSNEDDLESGAVTRAILVFVAISVLFIIYVAFKTYRNKNNKHRAVVLKYGVRAKRGDLEMIPFPLSEDEEDETVFDLTANRGST